MSLKEELRAAVINKYGIRVQNNKCRFCQKELSAGEFCDCGNSLKINRYYSKVYKKIAEIANWEAVNDCPIQNCYKVALPLKFAGMDFADYKTTEPQSVEKTAVLNAVKEFYQNICVNYLSGNNLLLIGKYGTGKTMLMSILADNCIKKGFQVKFINIVELFEEIKDTFNNTGKIRTKYYIDLFKKAEFLFLDDIDKKPQPTDYIKEIIYSIINYRVENELPTVISANSDLAELDKIFGEAIVSRLAQNARVVLFTHDNERLK